MTKDVNDTFSLWRVGLCASQRIGDLDLPCYPYGMKSLYAVIAAIALLTQPASAQEQKQQTDSTAVFEVDPNAKGLQPPLGELNKWLGKAVVKPVSYVLIALHDQSRLDAVMIVYEAGLQVQVLRDPDRRTLNAISTYVSVFKKEKKFPKSVILAMRLRDGDYRARVSYDNYEYTNAANFDNFQIQEFSKLADTLRPPE